MSITTMVPAAGAGMDADAICETGPGDDEPAASVAQDTGKAIDRDVFSAPGYVFDDAEAMWGQVRLDHVAKSSVTL